MSGTPHAKISALPPTRVQGADLFEEQRKVWRSGLQSQEKSRRIPVAEIEYDALLDSIANCTDFEEKVPLPVLVDALNDLWEADGMFE